jgi:hypothetical protein
MKKIQNSLIRTSHNVALIPDSILRRFDPLDRIEIATEAGGRRQRSDGYEVAVIPSGMGLPSIHEVV